MICFVCNKEIIGPYLQVECKRFLCRHIECHPNLIVAKSEVVVKAKDVITYTEHSKIDDPDSIINEYTIGGLNEKK